jgi:hypothetical protein
VKLYPSYSRLVADVWGTLPLVDTAAEKSSFAMASVLIIRLERYTIVDTGDTNYGLTFTRSQTGPYKRDSQANF